MMFMLEPIHMNRLIKISMLSLVVFIAACGGEELAVVGGKTITQQQFEDYLKVKRIGIKDEAQRQAVLKQFLEREALAQAVEESGILNENLIEAELNELRKEVLVSRYMEQYLTESASDEAVLNYYNSHSDEFETRKIHVAHILLRANPAMDETQRKAKLTAAQEAYSRIKAGKDFAEVAKSYSEDAVTSKKGGDLGWLDEGSVAKNFSDKIFAMKTGDISEPFETEFGFHIVKVLEGPVTAKQSFEAVQGDIRYKLRNDMRQAEIDRLMATVEIDQD